MKLDRNGSLVYFIAKAIRLILLPFAKLKFGKKKVWIVCENGKLARDNGYHMFRYLRKEHPQTSERYPRSAT